MKRIEKGPVAAADSLGWMFFSAQLPENYTGLSPKDAVSVFVDSIEMRSGSHVPRNPHDLTEDQLAGHDIVGVIYPLFYDEPLVALVSDRLLEWVNKLPPPANKNFWKLPFMHYDAYFPTL
ncbi:MAG: hypothetical protein Q7S84_00260 [bacterium]|nr:hypothetical protein [bacterium]